MLPTSIKIIKKLRKAGFKAYWAGGCVRDILIGRVPKDFDIVTDAKPDEIEEVLSHTIPVGKEFGVILTIQNGHQFEVATFRSDSGYSDGRRPDAVMFTDAEEDARRRDFTINGLFYDPIDDKILDFVNGQKDLEARLIRFIGDPHERIMEDHLRILRAVRFKNELNFQYSPSVFREVTEHAVLLKKVSSERIRDELNKLIVCDKKVQAFEDLLDTDILQNIMPELAETRGVAQPHEYHKEGDVWQHTMQCLGSLTKENSLNVHWAVLLHDIGKTKSFKLKERIRFDKHVEYSEQMARKILNRLKFPSADIARICWLIEHHMVMVPLTTMNVGRRRTWFLKPGFKELLEVFKSDIKGTDPQDYKLYDEIVELYKKDLKEMPKEPKPLLTGEEIMKILNIKPGKKIGEIKDQLKEMQLSKELKSKRQAKKWLQTL